MKPRTIVGLVAILIGSLGIGWFAGNKGYSVFESTVPAGSVTELVRTGTKAGYLTGGLLLGLLIFAWTTLVAWLARLLGGTDAPSGSTPAAK